MTSGVQFLPPSVLRRCETQSQNSPPSVSTAWVNTFANIPPETSFPPMNILLSTAASREGSL